MKLFHATLPRIEGDRLYICEYFIVKMFLVISGLKRYSCFFFSSLFLIFLKKTYKYASSYAADCRPLHTPDRIPWATCYIFFLFIFSFFLFPIPSFISAELLQLLPPFRNFDQPWCHIAVAGTSSPSPTNHPPTTVRVFTCSFLSRE